jgi:hypothetical protein
LIRGLSQIFPPTVFDLASTPQQRTLAESRPEQRFEASLPDQIRATDITDLRAHEGRL